MADQIINRLLAVVTVTNSPLGKRKIVPTNARPPPVQNAGQILGKFLRARGDKNQNTNQNKNEKQMTSLT